MFDVSVEMLCNLKDCGWELYSPLKPNMDKLVFCNGGKFIEISFSVIRNSYILRAYYDPDINCRVTMTYEDMFIFTRLMNKLEVASIDRHLMELEERRKCILQK